MGFAIQPYNGRLSVQARMSDVSITDCTDRLYRAEYHLNKVMVIMLTTFVQPYACLLPPRVLEPGKAVGTITDQMAELTGLPKACTVCAGTSGLLSLCPASF